MMAALTEEERGKLGAEDFAVPHRRMLPIHDEGHARQAWNELDRTGGLDTFEKEEARHRIVRALHRFGVSFPGVEEERRSLTEGGDPQGKGLVDAGHTLEAVVVEDSAGGHVVEVTIARPGVSQNGYIYSESVLREGTHLWDGAPAFLDHPTALDLTRAGSRSLRDLVGVYEGAVYQAGRGIRARLRLSPNDQGVFSTIKDSIEARGSGRVGAPVGISADWRLLHSAAKGGEHGGSPVRGQTGKALRQVHSILGVNSGDLVVRPSAGGSFDRILESVAGEPVYAGKEWALAENGAAVAAAVGGDTADTLAREASAKAGSTGFNSSAAAAEVTDARFQAMVGRAVADALAPVRQQLASAELEAKLGSSGLPARAQSHLREQLSGRVYEAGEIDSAIGSLREMLGDVFGQSSIRGVGRSVLDAGAAQGIGPMERVQAAFDKLFGLPVDAALTNVPRLTGIREAYVLLTGDKFFTGNYHLEESIVREANEVTTSSLANVVLNSMTKRLVRDYQAQPKCSTRIHWRTVRAMAPLEFQRSLKDGEPELMDL